MHNPEQPFESEQNTLRNAFEEAFGDLNVEDRETTHFSGPSPEVDAEDIGSEDIAENFRVRLPNSPTDEELKEIDEQIINYYESKISDDLVTEEVAGGANQRAIKLSNESETITIVRTVHEKNVAVIVEIT